jgi:purine-binding chemotaxis protein CheW
MTVFSTDAGSAGGQFVTLLLADQLFGVPVLQVRDILREQVITRIPLASPEIAGSLNLRGRIATAIDLRRRLRLPAATPGTPRMSVVTERQGDLYALIVDQVCEVLTPGDAALERNPLTLTPDRARYCSGLYRMETSLMLVLDLDRVLSLAWEA